MAKRDKRASAVAVVPAPAQTAGASNIEAATGAKDGSASAPIVPWQKPRGLTARQWAVLGSVLLLINLPILHHFLRGPMDSVVSIPFSEDFSQAALVAQRYFSTGSQGELRNGVLISPGVRNNALWLKASLPDNVRVALETRAVAAEADIRVEVFGNGEDTLSGYRLVLSPSGPGSRGVLYRLGEQGPSWSELRARAGSQDLTASGVYSADTVMHLEGSLLPLHTNEPQHWVVERRGATLRWTINDQLALEFTDPFPLTGRWHDRLGLSSNEMDVIYDHLNIAAAPATAFPPLLGAAAISRVPAMAFADSFERSLLGPDWNPTEPAAVQINEGAVVIKNAHNHPVWLKRPLPDNAVLELDAWSDSAEGDLKVEAWGDGLSAHQGELHAAYNATGYVFVMGGWHNTKSVIARREEHGHDGAQRTDVRVEPGRHYHWRITRRGGRLQWDVDGTPFLTLEDPDPLLGAEQAYFAFSDWETRVHFDNLRVTPLTP